MRCSGKWMVLLDDRILEYLREADSGTPSEIADHECVRYSRQHISQRASTLVDHGLAQHLGNGVYVITEDGEQYLEGERDTGEDD